MGNFPNNILYADISSEDKGIIEKYLRNIPVDIDAMVGEFKIKLIAQPMDDKIAGILNMEKKPYEIIYNTIHAKVRQRFTIAHELGHYILHGCSGLRIQDSNVYDSSLSRARETEANRFAADILMPYTQIESYVSRHPSITLPEIAQYFNVSTVAMSIRLGFPT